MPVDMKVVIATAFGQMARKKPIDKITVKDVVEACRNLGALCCTAGEHVVRFIPPLNIPEKDIAEALDMISDALDQLWGDAE